MYSTPCWTGHNNMSNISWLSWGLFFTFESSERDNSHSGHMTSQTNVGKFGLNCNVLKRNKLVYDRIKNVVRLEGSMAEMDPWY